MGAFRENLSFAGAILGVVVLVVGNLFVLLLLVGVVLQVADWIRMLWGTPALVPLIALSGVLAVWGLFARLTRPRTGSQLIARELAGLRMSMSLRGGRLR